jgi:hypothetical protein
MGPTWEAGHVSCLVYVLVYILKVSCMVVSFSSSRRNFLRVMERVQETYPFQSNLPSGLDSSPRSITFSLFVTHYLYTAKLVRSYEAIVQVIGLPTNGRWNGGLILQRCVLRKESYEVSVCITCGWYMDILTQPW